MSFERDRILPMTDVLLGAVYADAERTDAEIEAVKKLLGSVFDGELPSDVAARLDAFDPATFALDVAIEPFADDAPALKRKLLELVAAVRDADDIVDFEEDAYVMRVAAMLGVAKADYADLVLDLEVEELTEVAETVARGAKD
ncbi:MAG: TerB family tellurite resistance protein [Deltaproteobacteria bacterium]|nr:TerB family tellurite resistance protein [Deltaproteobacteria bacterium]